MVDPLCGHRRPLVCLRGLSLAQCGRAGKRRHTRCRRVSIGGLVAGSLFRRSGGSQVSVQLRDAPLYRWTGDLKLEVFQKQKVTE